MAPCGQLEEIFPIPERLVFIPKRKQKQTDRVPKVKDS